MERNTVLILLACLASVGVLSIMASTVSAEDNVNERNPAEIMSQRQQYVSNFLLTLHVIKIELRLPQFSQIYMYTYYTCTF